MTTNRLIISRAIIVFAACFALLLVGIMRTSLQAQSDTVLLQTSLENLETISDPLSGAGGTTTLTESDFVSVDGRMGAQAVADDKVIYFPSSINGFQHIEFDQGELELWYRPNYNSDFEDVPHSLITIGNVYDVPRIELVESDFFSFAITDQNWNTSVAAAAYRAPLWAAGEWVHIRATWDTASVDDAIALYVNGQRVDEGGALGGWDLGDETSIGDIFVGSANEADEFPADGLIAELVIRGEPGEGLPVADSPPPVTDNTPDDPPPIDDTQTDSAAAPTNGDFSFTLVDDNFRHGQGIEVVDIDRDGDDDIVVAISLNDTVYLYVNDGTGNFQRVNVAPENSIAAMWAASEDYDNDGDLDIAAVSLFDRDCEFCSPGEVIWYENTGDVTSDWIAHELSDSMWGLRYIISGDLTGDGCPDLIVSELRIDSDGAGVHWFRNTGGNFEGPFAVDAELSNVERVLLYDVDANGTLDILATANWGDEIAWYANSGGDNPSFSKFTIDRPDGPYDLLLLDHDGDDIPELIATSDNGILMYSIPADPSTAWIPTIIDPEFGATGNPRLTAGDLNGDGRMDFAVTMNSADFGVSELRWYLNNDDDTWTPQVVTPAYFGLVDAKAADFDGDGSLELVTTTYNHTDSNDEVGLWEIE